MKRVTLLFLLVGLLVLIQVTVAAEKPVNGSLLMKVDQAWGYISGFEVVGDIAFAAVGSQLVVFDVSNTANPTPIVHSEALNNSLNGLIVDGDFVYVWGGIEVGFSVFDVSVANRPKLITSRRDAPIVAAQQSGNYVYALNNNEKVLVYDVSKPRTPELIRVRSVSALRTIGVTGKTMFTDFEIYDVSVPAEPKFINNFSGAHVRYVDSEILVTSTPCSFTLYTLEAPQNPQLETCTNFWTFRGMDRQGDILVADLFWDAGFITLDISDPGNVTELDYYAEIGPDTTGYHRQIHVDDNTIYYLNSVQADIQTFTLNEDGTTVGLGIAELPTNISSSIAVSDEIVAHHGSFESEIVLLNPRNLKEIFGVAPVPSHEIVDMAFNNDRLYAVDQIEKKLYIIDVSDPSSPQLVASSDLDFFPSEVIVSDSALVLTADYGGLIRLHIFDPISLSQIEPQSFFDILGYYATHEIAGSTLFVSSDLETRFYDLANLSQPQSLWSSDSTIYSSFAVDGDTLYAGQDAKVVSIDISNPASPVFLDSVDLNLIDGITILGDTLIVNDWNSNMFSPDGRDLVQIDISNPENLTITSNIPGGYGEVFRHVSNSYALYADSFNGDGYERYEFVTPSIYLPIVRD